MGTQCCVGAKYRITRSVSTETNVATYAEIGIQVNIDPEDNGAKDITPDTSAQVYPKKPKGENDKPVCKRKLTLYEEVYPSDEEPLPSPSCFHW